MWTGVKTKAEFLVLQIERLEGGLLPLAVLLLDVERDRLYTRTRSDIDDVSVRGDAEILAQFLSDLSDDALTESGSAIIANLEDTLSNAVRITERTPIEVEGIELALESLYYDVIVAKKY